jgi:hypothetical protein
MAASVHDIRRVLRATGEFSTESTYSDDDVRGMVERYPLPDSAGNEPDATGWSATYDVNAAIGDLWDEKAASLAANYDFSADGGSYSRSQAYEHAQAQARIYRARRVSRARPVELAKPEQEFDTDDLQS